jgi:peptidyl-prolyl cis-trans isomerase C
LEPAKVEIAEVGVFANRAAMLTLRTADKEMRTAVKSLIRFVVLDLVLIFAGWCFAKSASQTQQAPSQAGPAEPAKPVEEEVIPPAEPGAIFPAVVARVNGKPILGRELEALVRNELATIGSPEWRNLREDYRGELTLQGLNTLIQNELFYQKAQASGVKVTSAEVQAEMQRISKNYGSDAEMNAALASRMTDRASLEKSLYQSLAATKYIDENVNKKITVAPEEVAKHYAANPTSFHHPDVVRSSHILIRAGDTAELDALSKKRAEELLARVKKGEDFAKLAREYSMDGSASAGGDIGYNDKASLTPEYGEAAFSLPVGGVKLIKSEFGYHIIKVTDKKQEGLYTLEEIGDRLTQYLKTQKTQAELAKLVNQLRDEAKIEILIPAGQPLNP